MRMPVPYFHRRHFLGGLAAGAALWQTPGLFAEELSRTPQQTEGPFYPDRLPLDTDNDLLRLNDGATPALGQVAHLTGRVLTAAGSPVRNAVVEIWQCDANGVYLHSRSPGKEKQDANFQGFGRFLTSSTGEYYFRTIKPVQYVPRTPHIHVAVMLGDKRVLTTQLYVKGEPLNQRDGIFRSLGNQAHLLEVPFAPIQQSRAGELAANFDVVIGMTPEDNRRER